MQLSENLTTATVALLDALDEKQTDHALFPFDETERRSWYYWPAERRGVALWELDRSQTKAVHRLLATVLPVPAFARTVTIMALDEVLDRLEHHAGDRRHRDDYWLSIFGEPGDESWGLRFEGHHVSVHVTVREGDVWSTPLFLGANPAVVHDGLRAAIAPLALEEQLGFELLHALPVEQRSSAIVADVAPNDIVTRNAPRLDGVRSATRASIRALEGAAGASCGCCSRAFLPRTLSEDAAVRTPPTPRSRGPAQPSPARATTTGSPGPACSSSSTTPRTAPTMCTRWCAIQPATSATTSWPTTIEVRTARSRLRLRRPVAVAPRHMVDARGSWSRLSAADRGLTLVVGSQGTPRHPPLPEPRRKGDVRIHHHR